MANTTTSAGARSNALNAPGSPDQAHLWLAEALAWAAAQGATDLHFFPGPDSAALWARIDGSLREVAKYPHAYHERLVARLKVLGRCTDYDGELALEGRFTLDGDALQGSGGEARLAILPTLHGDKAAVRLLNGRDRPLRFDELGWPATLARTMRAALETPQGLILTIGPAGSGKSTALYALLADMNARSMDPLAVVTIEDPVEAPLVFASQVAVQPARGLDFPRGLRALLRHDPEVIMIGEIRDPETATTALQAAMTGHRLLSSMHTLTAAEALLRLRQMGAPLYIIASALGGLLNVRLARKLCRDCAQPRELTESERALFPESSNWQEPAAHEAPGCEACFGTGFRGRTGLAEWLTLTPETADALHNSAAAPALARTLRIVEPARAGALEHILAGRIAPGELQLIAGMGSLQRSA